MGEKLIMRKEMEKTYNPGIVEDKIYDGWLAKGYFHAEIDGGKEPYTIMIPPPNITGQLHLGHVFGGAVQDAIIRRKRMQGYSALYMPGTDHASIATEVKIVEDMAKEGLTKDGIGRDGFLERAWKWRDTYGGIISRQYAKLGVSCDWERERFTMDEGLSAAVVEFFNRLYEKGYVYRGERLVNWCANCMTSLSDAEVEHEEKESGFWTFKYPVKGTDEFLAFSTTRPETMLGDTAIAVNPKDERYARFVGMTCVVPIVNREIPVIADEYVEADFGTGAVKITPGHDFNDFEVGARHKLRIISIINDDGTINENGGKYEGQRIEEARGKIIEEFRELGLFVKKETVRNSVGVHDRCSAVAEPMVKLQWFVKMEELAKPAIEAYKSGELRILPERFGKVYLHWLENIRDWCVSRQLWWGHRIPAWYCSCGEIIVARAAPSNCIKCNSMDLKQDEDILDTWFSSALWPFSTLGWPEKTRELEYFYPTQTLVTAYEIIFFWVVRMVFSGIELMGKLPFRDVLITGLVRDEQGRKLSKSLGNGADPLEVIEKYGSDALRFSMVTGNTVGNDLRFYIEKVEAARNFTNKIWNAARFVLMQESSETAGEYNLRVEDKWILSKLNGLVKEADGCFEEYELGLAAAKVYEFIWDEYCDWYIEMVKPRLYDKTDVSRGAALRTLKTVLGTAMQLLHPFMPFISEEIYGAVSWGGGSVMVSKWPEFDAAMDYGAEANEIEMIKDAVRGIRNIKAEMNVPPSKKPVVYLVSGSAEVRDVFGRGRGFAAGLGSAAEIVVLESKDERCENAVSAVIPSAELFVRFDELIDYAKERERLGKEKAKLEKEVERAAAKLANEGFTAKAPEAVIAEERAKLETYREMLAKVTLMLDKIK
jgi:valyl-tRNA synthetase